MNKLSKISVEDRTDQSDGKKPQPSNFEMFLPWAVNQMLGTMNVIITKVSQGEYISVRASERSKAKPKGKTKAEPDSIETSKDDSAKEAAQVDPYTQNAINIIATYDLADNLINIKFDKNRTIPRHIFKIIILIVKFYPYLTGITINQGLNMAIVHEIQNLLPISNITDVCLDNNYVKEGNYDILLQKQANLKYLSLARCCINDVVVKNIAINLQHPSKASKTLCLLNLGSNRITDVGAKYIADALRTNRKLSYLNLSGNMITDCGAAYIFDVLMEFMLTNEELAAYKTRHMTYLRDRNAMIVQIVKELKASDTDGKLSRKKITKPATAPLPKKTKGIEREHSIRGISKSSGNMDVMWQEKANQMAEAVIGPFSDPFSSNNTFLKDNITYCFGNNSIAYLNLAYNELSYIILKKILGVVNGQKTYDRRPRGLVNLCIEGNPMPQSCKELANLNDLIERGLNDSKDGAGKKKPSNKSVTRYA